MTRKKEKCARCHGIGRVWKKGGDWITVLCKKCNGSGNQRPKDRSNK